MFKIIFTFIIIILLFTVSCKSPKDRTPDAKDSSTSTKEFSIGAGGQSRQYHPGRDDLRNSKE